MSFNMSKYAHLEESASMTWEVDCWVEGVVAPSAG